ncbi:hypothetical protein [Methanococcoides sp. FTZ1]
MEEKNLQERLRDAVLNSPDVFENMMQHGSPIERLLAATAVKRVKEAQ